MASEGNGGQENGHRRILVIANITCPCSELHDEIRSRATGPELEVLAVAPALNSRLRHWVSDTDDAVGAAAARLQRAVESLQEAGIEARGEVGDADPLTAIADALAVFRADEVIVSTHPPGRSHWLERGLVERARERHDVVVTHVVSAYGLEPVA